MAGVAGSSVDSGGSAAEVAARAVLTAASTRATREYGMANTRYVRWHVLEEELKVESENVENCRVSGKAGVAMDGGVKPSQLFKSQRG